jgi:hypothetical protein
VLRSKGRKTLGLKKSGSGSGRRPKYRLYRTLKRAHGFRDFKDEDIKYLWAAEKFNGHEVDPEEFKESIYELMNSSYDFAWIIEAIVKNNYRPVGVVFGINSGVFTLLSDTVWFPWASKRNIIEGMVGFINKIRKQMLVLGHIDLKNKPFGEYIARHGIIRRIGTVDDIYKDEPAALFQSRR